jgi:hypothetical protein
MQQGIADGRFPAGISQSLGKIEPRLDLSPPADEDISLLPAVSLAGRRGPSRERRGLAHVLAFSSARLDHDPQDPLSRLLVMLRLLPRRLQLAADAQKRSLAQIWHEERKPGEEEQSDEVDTRRRARGRGVIPSRVRAKGKR